MMFFFALNKAKNGPKRPYNSKKKRLKMHEKRQTKREFLDLKNLLFSGIFLNGQSLCSKMLSGKGGYPPSMG